MLPPETDDHYKEYQERLGKNYKLVSVETPDEDGNYHFSKEKGRVGVCYYSLYALHGGVNYMKGRYYRLKEDDVDDVYGTFYEKDGMVYPTQHKWKWVKDTSAYGEKRGEEVLSKKEPKPSKDFFKVMKEVDSKEYNDLWGLNLERL